MKTIKLEELISPIARAILDRGDKKERAIEADEKKEKKK